MKKNKLSIIIHTNSDEKINYALSISAVAAAIDRKVELFFAGETVNNLVSEDILNAKNKHSKLTFSNSGELLNANKELNTRFLICSGALNENKIPIIAPLGLGKNEQTYNINGDTAASAIAKKLKSRRLILMTNVEGVYDDQKKLISEIKPFDLENLIKWKVVQGGMIPKIENCVDAVQNGVRGVVILDGRKPHSILHEIFSDKGSGTLIRE